MEVIDFALEGDWVDYKKVFGFQDYLHIKISTFYSTSTLETYVADKTKRG